MDDLNRLIACQQMFRHACAFSECSDMAKKRFKHETADIEWYITPATVNSAFVCEVYIKALMKYYGVKTAKKHKLKELYEALPEKAKEWIKITVRNYYGGIWMNPFGFECLDNISDAFEQWRYSYEHDWNESCTMNIDLGFLMAFRNALREACSQLFFGKTWEEYIK